ncbi:hypothetical protein LPJGGPFB_06600 [Ensifer adhaerens]|nr:hypothetical protein [Ensifer adhaerens]
MKCVRADLLARGRSLFKIDDDAVGGGAGIERVVAGSAIIAIVAVSRFPRHADRSLDDDGVIAGATRDDIVALAAGQRVVAGAAIDDIVAVIADQRVVFGVARKLVVTRAGDHGLDAVDGVGADLVARGRSLFKVDDDALGDCTGIERVVA